MRIDLFEFLDGLFRGILYFFYNLAESAFWVVRRPIRGPALLYRVHKDKTRRQLGGLTFLFVTYFAVYASLYFLADPQSGPPLLRTMMPALGGSFDISWWWVVFLASVVSTIIVDALLRIVLRLRFRKRRVRERILGTTEYALFLPVLLATPWAAILVASNLFSLLSPVDWGALLRGLAALVLVGSVATIPAAASFWPSLRRGRAHGRRREARQGPAAAIRAAGARALPFAPRSIALSTLAALASLTGAGLGFMHIFSQTILQDRLIVEQLECRILEDRPYIDVVLHNRSQATVPVNFEDLSLHIGRARQDEFSDWVPGEGQSVGLRNGDDAFGSPALLRPGDTALVRGWLTTRPSPAPEASSDCLLHGTVSAGVGGNSSRSIAVHGEPGTVRARSAAPAADPAPATR